MHDTLKISDETKESLMSGKHLPLPTGVRHPAHVVCFTESGCTIMAQVVDNALRYYPSHSHSPVKLLKFVVRKEHAKRHTTSFALSSEISRASFIAECMPDLHPVIMRGLLRSS